MASQNGWCNCSSITVSLATAPAEVVRCHCLNCRRAGGPYSINYVIDEQDVSVKDTKGSLQVYMDTDTQSGGVCKRYFCSSCGSPVYSISERAPGKLFVKASLFEQVPSAVASDVFDSRTIHWEQK